MEMALETSVVGDVQKLSPEPKLKERKEMKRLRNAGMEYVSRSGKLVPAKTQSDVLCQCPQRCADKIPADVRENLFSQFYKLGDHEMQNEFLQAHIETLAVKKRRDRPAEPVPGVVCRAQRRVTCRYLIPLLANPGDSMQPGPNPGTRNVEVCQKAFMHMFSITEKRVRLQREKLIAKVKADQREDDHLDLFTEAQMCEMRSRNTAVPPKDFEVFCTELDRDVNIVNNFFINQLWKPEYIAQ